MPDRAGKAPGGAIYRTALDSPFGPIGIFVFVLMMMFIQFQLAIRSAELITRVPDAVADLVGGYLSRMGGENAGGHAERLYGATHQRISTGTQITRKALSPASKAAGAAGGAAKGVVEGNPGA